MKKNSSEKAYEMLHRAEQTRLCSDDCERRTGERDHFLDIQAASLKVNAHERLKGKEIQRVAGGEVSSKFLDTIDNPGWTNTNASHDRMSLASQAGCFDMAVDAAETVGAQNSLEKMLAHQLAACHHAGMKLMSQVGDCSSQLGAGGDADVRLQRVVNSATKLMTTFQQGMVSIQRMRTGGKQSMTVEHVHVHEGGQAVVGNLNQSQGGLPPGGPDEK